MLFTQSWVIDPILPLLAPGGFSWFNDASNWSSSVMTVFAIFEICRSTVVICLEYVANRQISPETVVPAHVYQVNKPESDRVSF